MSCFVRMDSECFPALLTRNQILSACNMMAAGISGRFAALIAGSGLLKKPFDTQRVAATALAAALAIAEQGVWASL